MTTAFLAPRARVDISGVTLAADVSRHVLSVRYDSNLDLADMFTVVLDNAGNRFTDSPLFELGKDVEVHLGYGDDLEPMMLGEIASIEPSFPGAGAPTLTISGYDRSYRLRHDVPDRPAFRYMNDSLIAAQIALEAGLIPVVDPTPFPPHTVLPRTAPDMAILKELALFNFFETYVWWDRLYFGFPRPQTDAVVLSWGSNLSSFEPRLSNAGLAGLQAVRGYNEELAMNIVGVVTTAALDLDSVLERLGEAAVGALTALGRRVLVSHSVKSPVDATLLAKALLQEILEGMYEATGACVGLPGLRAGRVVEVVGVGKRFSGRYRLRRVTHVLDNGGYRTEFDVTQRASSSLLGQLRRAAVHTPPPDRREPVNGVMVGVVRLVDPLRYTVSVSLPPLSTTDVVEAKCTSFMAGAGRGGFFLPEIGDQVLVAFAGGDLAQAYVIGSLWSNVDTKPVVGLPGVQRLRSRTGLTVTLDDTAGRLVVEHPTGTSISLGPDGSVSIDAVRDIALNAPTGTITMTATNVKVRVAGTMDVSGLGA